MHNYEQFITEQLMNFLLILKQLFECITVQIKQQTERQIKQVLNKLDNHPNHCIKVIVTIIKKKI